MSNAKPSDAIAQISHCTGVRRAAMPGPAPAGGGRTEVTPGHTGRRRLSAFQFWVSSAVHFADTLQPRGDVVGNVRAAERFAGVLRGAGGRHGPGGDPRVAPTDR